MFHARKYRMLQGVGRLARTAGHLASTRRCFGTGSKEKYQIQLSAGAAAVFVLGGVFAARSIYEQFLNNNGHQSIRRDESKATVLLKTVAPAKPLAQFQEMDAKEFEAFCREQRRLLAEAAKRNQQEAAEMLHRELLEVLPVDRIPVFSEWYFSYATTYKLLGVAMTSAMKHAVTIRKEQSLKERVSEELQEVVQQKYEALVLRPALTDPKIHRAFLSSLKHAHKSYLSALSEMEESVSKFVSEQSRPYAEPLQKDQVVVELDWTAQLQKIQHLPAAYEKTPTGVALVAGGAAAGKIAGGATMGGAAKAIAAKLASPFATKAAGAALGGKAVAGAATGTLVGGPLGGAVGAAAGAAIGVGVDMTVNLGVALMQRPALEKDVHDSLEETLVEWEERLLQELEHVQSVWYSHAKDALRSNHDEGNERQ